MRRIILIGNGFDRSLGYPTSYSHFLDWLFRRAFINLENAQPDTATGRIQYSYRDEFFTIVVRGSIFSKVKELIASNAQYSECLDVLSPDKNNGETIEIQYRDNFIELLFKNYDKEKWVDIEQLYFDYLLKTNEKQILKFNVTFNLLKKSLSEYLLSLKTHPNVLKKAYNSYRKHFFSPRLAYNYRLRCWEETKSKPERVYFVNFNYTFILRDLLEQDSGVYNDVNVQNHIHGDLYNPQEIIFGYGNETSKEYFEVEKRSNLFLENIKSNNYFNSTHYKDLLLNLEKQFEVYIYGLSCGLSDHILLKTIMEHRNCFHIRMFYRKNVNQDDNFKETLINLSRAFSDKALMRSRIISKQDSDWIPQHPSINSA